MRSIGIAEEKLDCREGTIFSKFLKNSHLYCFACFQSKNFVGFTASSINESFHALIKRIQPSEKDYVVAFKNLVDCFQSLIDKCEDFQLEKTEFEDIFKVPEIKGLRLCLTTSIFSHFISDFAEVMLL